MSSNTSSSSRENIPGSKPVEPGSRGFVFAATGEKYVLLARRAARNLRLVHPDAKIDLFSNLDIIDPVFDQIHRLENDWFRPKMEGLLRSRFERTVYLDADIMVVGSVEGIFDVLETFDMAACHERFLNAEHARRVHRRVMPTAFPTVNSGVLGIRHSQKTQAFLKHWQSEVRTTESNRDQPALRELLFESDLRICTLPPTFNFMSFHELSRWWGVFGAPRVLHSPGLHQTRTEYHDPETPFTLEEVVGLAYSETIKVLIESDYDLTPDDQVTRERVSHDYIVTNPVKIWARTYVRPILNYIRYRGKRPLGHWDTDT